MASTGILDILGADLTATLDHVLLGEGETLFVQGEASDALFLVKRGRLQAVVTQADGSAAAVGEIGPGEPVGEMQLFAGGRRTATVRALQETELLALPAALVERLAADFPDVFERLVQTVRQRLRRNHLIAHLPDFFGSLDEAALQDLEARIAWVQLRQGERLLRQGDPGEAMFIVVSGRLQVVLEQAGGAEAVLLEIGRGETVGEMALFTGERRAASVYALRDSVLVQVSQAAFDHILTRYPRVHRHVTRTVLRRLRRAALPRAPTRNVTNVAVVPLHPEAPLTAFTERLVQALSAFGACLHLSPTRLDGLLGRTGAAEAAEDDPDNLRLAAWLDEQERRHRFVVFEADAAPSPWTQRCLRQADRILLVAHAEADPTPGALEATLPGGPRPVGQVLVLVHPDGRRLPSGTHAWRAPRRLEAHRHLRWDTPADFARLARLLADRSVGLVLGGGGARGFAHLGVLRAFAEADVPVDVVGGTSMGAAIATQAALGWDYETMLRRTREALVEAKPFRAFTLSLFSLLRSKKFDAVTRMFLGDLLLEDFWTPCFVVSSCLSTAEVTVHEEGLAWKAVRASSAIPGVMEPVLDGARLYVDGALLNNLPVDLMRQRCSGQVVAVDVSDMEDLHVTAETAPSPWDFIKSRWMPSRDPIAFPTLPEVLVRATLLGSAEKARTARADADLYLRPPVERFGLLEFAAIEEIAEIGYRYARDELARWLARKPEDAAETGHASR